MVEIIEQIKNPLMNREEIVIIVEAESTPSTQDATKIVAQEFGKQEEVIAIKNIVNKFGDNKFTIIANIYDSAEAKEKTEPKPKKKAGGAETPAPAESAPAEKPAEEEKKEEAKPEEKPAEEPKEEEK